MLKRGTGETLKIPAVWESWGSPSLGPSQFDLHFSGSQRAPHHPPTAALLPSWHRGRLRHLGGYLEDQLSGRNGAMVIVSKSPKVRVVGPLPSMAFLWLLNGGY